MSRICSSPAGPRAARSQSVITGERAARGPAYFQVSSLLTISWALFFAFALLPDEAFAWGKGHTLIRTWAVDHLPEWQREFIGEEFLKKLCIDYKSLQDQHAGGKNPHLDPYCLVPGVRLSLHDINPAEKTAAGIAWYLDRITDNLQRGNIDESMKFLGVLCHWNEDPGCPSAHSSPISEEQLKTLLPPTNDTENLNFLFGYGGIADTGKYRIPNVDYTPRLLGRDRDEITLRIFQRQRLLEKHAASHIIPVAQAMIRGDLKDADKHRAAAALYNAKHVADVIHTVLCYAKNRFSEDEALHELTEQSLTEWLPEPRGKRPGHPYYVTCYLVDQAMDAKRKLHPLAFSDDSPVATGFGTGAPYSIEYLLVPGNVYTRFTCRAGLHPAAGPSGKVAFAVVANGKEIHRTKPIRSGQPPVSIDVALPSADVLELSLKTVPAEGSESLDNLAVWGKPTLVR